MKRIIITGAAGFIGGNLVLNLLETDSEYSIVGIDNLNNYYDIDIKKARLAYINEFQNGGGNKWEFVKTSISDKSVINSIFEDFKPDIVVNLAAQAGVRYSIDNPDVYIESNVIGFYNILEACRHSYEKSNRSYKGVEHLIYASSSSVYGLNAEIPYCETDKTDAPASFYAATKKSNEIMAHSYSKLYNIPSTGLRFFTVYGPLGRPDMAYWKFADALVKKEKIKIYNYGNCQRDFTYIDDIIKGIKKIISNPPIRRIGNDGLPIPPYKLYNIGNGKPVDLMCFVRILIEELMTEKVLPSDFNISDYIELTPIQPGDVVITYADTTALENEIGYKPSTDLRDGLKKFAKWYKLYHQEK